jgi:hypothetical protein
MGGIFLSDECEFLGFFEKKDIFFAPFRQSNGGILIVA